MGDAIEYSMNMDVLYGFLTRVDIPKLIRECDDPWWNQTLCQVNDCVVRLGIIKGDFHWHKHDDEDEFFFVVQGKLFIDVEDEESVELQPHEGYTVPKGVVHRARAPERTAILMVEKASVDPTGD